MRRAKLAALCLAAALLHLSACGAEAQPDARHSVALVAKSTQTEFWLSVFAGAEAAAAEYNLELTTVGPETEEDYETQNEMIARAVEAGTEALVFSAIDFEKNAPAVDAAAQAGRPHRVHRQRCGLQPGEHLYRHRQLRRRTDGGPGGPGAGGGPPVRGAGQLRRGHRQRPGAGAGRAGRPGPVRPGQRGRRDHHPGGRRAGPGGHRRPAGRAPGHQRPGGLQRAHQRWAAQAVEELGLEEQVFLVGFDSNVATIEGLQTGAWTPSWFRTPMPWLSGGGERLPLLTGQAEELAPMVDTSTQIVYRSNLFSLDSQKALFAFG